MNKIHIDRTQFVCLWGLISSVISNQNGSFQAIASLSYTTGI